MRGRLQGGFAAPADLVPSVRLLLSPQAAYITGETFGVSGGMGLGG